MPESLDFVLRGIAMGVAGSVLMDAWSAVLRRRFAAARSPHPAATRLRNLGTHVVYGIGLYAAASALAVLPN